MAVEIGRFGGEPDGGSLVAGAVPVEEHPGEEATGMGLLWNVGQFVRLAQGCAEMVFRVIPGADRRGGDPAVRCTRRESL